MSVNQRIKFLVEEELKINQKEFSLKTGVSEHTISNTILHKSTPRIEVLVSICKAYENLSLNWLFLGKGPMWIESGRKFKKALTFEEPQLKYIQHLNSEEDVSYLKKQLAEKNQIIQEKEEQIKILKEYIDLLKNKINK